VSHPVRPPADADVAAPSSGATGAGARGRGSGASRRQGSARDRILDVSRELFCARGYERTPLRAVSDALGVTKAAIYYHFKAKDEILVALVGPVLDRIDELIASTGAGLSSSASRRDFLGRYVDELAGNAGIVTLLVRDPGLAEHALGRRFAAQHARMRVLLGAGDDPASVIRATTALRALELAVVEFGDTHPGQVRETALTIAVSVLDSAAR
jgi:AcrR family transcriptional regulator